MTYLTESELIKPQVGLTALTHEDEIGFVEVNFSEGSLLLTDSAGSFLRVPWEKTGQGDTPKGKLAVPEGNYTLVSYRILDRSREGEVWHLSATARSIMEIEVQAGEIAKVEIDPTIHIKQGFKRGMVSMSVSGMEKAGLTIYKNGKRIPMDWKLVAGEDESVADGKINYG